MPATEALLVLRDGELVGSLIMVHPVTGSAAPEQFPGGGRHGAFSYAFASNDCSSGYPGARNNFN